MTAALQVKGLSKSWGAFRANWNIDLSVEPGARHALIGPNGAGKTTLVNLLTGVYAPDAGSIELAGEDVTRLSQHARVRKGLSRTFQILTLFPALTPLESVVLAILERKRAAHRMWMPWTRREEEIHEAREILASLRLEKVAGMETRLLPYGQQRLVEIALALATQPRVLLLDEPAAGIPSDQSPELLARITSLPSDVAILFIEHDMKLVFRFAQKITVLASGQVLEEGPPSAIARSDVVRAIYLGERAHA